jgi:hypothetical protein
MQTWRVVALMAAVLGLSCGTGGSGGSGSTGSASGSDPGAGGSSDNAGGSSSPGASGGAGSSGTGGSASGTGGSANGTTNSGSGSGAAGGGSGSVDASVSDPNTVTITMGSFVVPAGKEVFMCQDFDNPFNGVDVAIGTSESDMTAGSHHLHVLYGEDSPASKTVSVCQNPFEFRSLLHVAGQPHLVTQYPAGMAAKLKGSVGLRLQAHYLNTASADYTANVVVRLTKVDPATVTKWVAQLYFNRTVLSVPPGNNQQVSTTCTVPSTYGPISLISGASHMHSRGIHYVANTSAGTKLVDTTEWDEPPIVAYDPPIGLNPGDSITWTCTYDNQTGGTLNFGDSAQKNEMCIFLARFYSAPSGDDIECQSATASGAGQVTNNVPQ